MREEERLKLMQVEFLPGKPKPEGVNAFWYTQAFKRNTLFAPKDVYSKSATLLVSASAPVLDHELLAEGHRNLSFELLQFLGLQNKKVSLDTTLKQLDAVLKDADVSTPPVAAGNESNRSVCLAVYQHLSALVEEEESKLTTFTSSLTAAGNPVTATAVNSTPATTTTAAATAAGTANVSAVIAAIKDKLSTK